MGYHYLRKEDIQPKKFGKEYFYTVEEFAVMVNRAIVSIRRLIYTGNSVRKLKVQYLYNKPLIPAKELTEFPFVHMGKPYSVYHYDKEGRVIDDSTNDTV